MQIHDYQCITPFATAGSGNARWCEAEKAGKRYFLKQFLAPVQPVQTKENPSHLVRQQRRRCADYEQKKGALYHTLKRAQNECIVHVEDFFVFDGHYFTASEYIDPSFPTFDTIRTMDEKAIKRLLVSLSECLRALHAIGVVHADLKPEHLMIDNRVGKNQVRLIDFDSGFLQSAPPDRKGKIEVDPVYMAPETYQLITGKPITLCPKLDTFAQGIILHQALTGEFPQFDHTQYSYLYACVLDRGKYRVADSLPKNIARLILRMLQRNPAKRPGDDTICSVLKASV